MLRKKIDFTLTDGTQVNPHRKSQQRLAKTTLDFSHQDTSEFALIETKKSYDAVQSGIKQLGDLAAELNEAQNVLNGGDHSIDGPFTRAATEIFQLKTVITQSKPGVDTSITELMDDLTTTADDAHSDLLLATKKARQIEKRLEEMTSRILSANGNVKGLVDAGLHKTKWSDINLRHFSTSKSAPSAGDAYLFTDADTAAHCVAQHHAQHRCADAKAATAKAKRIEAQRRDEKVTAELKALVSKIKDA